MPKRAAILFCETIGIEGRTDLSHQAPVPTAFPFRHEALCFRRFDYTLRIQAALPVRIDRPSLANAVPASASCELTLGKLHFDADRSANAAFTDNLKEHVDLRRLSALAEPLRHAVRAVLESDDNIVSSDDASFWQHSPKKPIRPRRVLGQGREEIDCEALTGIERPDPAVLETLNVMPPLLTEEIPCAMCIGEHPRPAYIQLDALGETIRRRPTA
jgi:hypothetical protein